MKVIDEKKVYVFGFSLFFLFCFTNILFALSRMNINSNKDDLIMSEKIIKSDFLVHAYYPSWKSTVFQVEKIPSGYFDRIIHAFIGIDKDGKLVVPNGYTSKSFMKDLQKKGSLVSVSIGGGNNSNGFQIIARSPDIRKKFIIDLKDFIEKNGYDGIDLDWEYPKGIQYIDFISLAIEIRKNIPKIKLTAALPLALSKNNIKNIALIQNHFDYIHVMAYDIEDAGDGYAGHNAPLYSNSKMPENLSIATLLKKEYIEKGVPREKLILGLPLYGRKFNVPQLYDKTDSSETIEFKDIPFDICKKINFGGSILQCYGYYISYDDIQSIEEKIDFAKNENLGGVFFWALGQDNNEILNGIEFK